MATVKVAELRSRSKSKRHRLTAAEASANGLAQAGNPFSLTFRLVTAVVTWMRDVRYIEALNWVHWISWPSAR